MGFPVSKKFSFADLFTSMSLQALSGFKWPRNVVAIVGPTASGKTSLAMELADGWQTEILSADSRQCYKEMSIGTAVPETKDLARIRHLFIGQFSIHDQIHVARFESLAMEWLLELWKTHSVAIVCGGTGLYLKAFLEGLDPVPSIASGVRASIEGQYRQNGLSWLQQKLIQKDPLHNRNKDWSNPRRLIRALEVLESTGQPLRSFQQKKTSPRDFRTIKIGLTLPKAELMDRISRRTDHMLEAGWLEEAARLLPFRHLPALQTVGYQELFEVLDGTRSLEQAAALIKTRTWQYAKRQMTWFRKDPEIHWFHPSNRSGIRETLNAFLEK